MSRLQRRAMDRFGKALFRYRSFLAGLPLAYAFVSRRWEWENEWGVWSIAIVLCLSGIALRGWASTHCYYAGSRRRRLACTGPYALVRNPLYLGNIFIIAGATSASELIWFLPISVLWAWAMYSIVFVTYEDRRLSRWYGEEYHRYRSAVPAWIPVLSSVTRLPSVPLRALVPQLPRLLLLLPFVVRELY